MQSLEMKSSRPKSFETEARPSRPRPRLKKTGLETGLETETKSRDSISGKWCTDRRRKCLLHLYHDCLAIIDTFAAIILLRHLPS